MAEETVNVNPDGSTTYDGYGAGGSGDEESTMPPVMDDAEGEPMMDEMIKGIDPAIYLLCTVILLAILYFVYARKSRSDDYDDFFTNLDGEKVRARLTGFDLCQNGNVFMMKSDWWWMILGWSGDTINPLWLSILLCWTNLSVVAVAVAVAVLVDVVAV